MVTLAYPSDSDTDSKPGAPDNNLVTMAYPSDSDADTPGSPIVVTHRYPSDSDKDIASAVTKPTGIG